MYYYQDQSYNDGNYSEYDYMNNGSNNYRSNCFDDKKHSCCAKKAPESFCCYPSYYDDDKFENKNDTCWQGYFKICPKYKASQNECIEKDYDDRHKNCHCKTKNNCTRNECHHRCCFGNIFRNW